MKKTPSFEDFINESKKIKYHTGSITEELGKLKDILSEIEDWAKTDEIDLDLVTELINVAQELRKNAKKYDVTKYKEN